MTDQSVDRALGHCKSRRFASLVLLCCLWPMVLLGQIFRYQDEQGIWHFTDAPPEGPEVSIVPDIDISVTASRDSAPNADLAAQLETTYNPVTPIAYATLAVVAVKTDYGEGSGFFCTEEGYILTNRHVVRPEPSDGLVEQDQALDDKERQLKAIKANLKGARSQLGVMKEDLNGYEELIANSRDTKTLSWAKEAQHHLAQRYQSERGKIASMERNMRRLKRDLRDAQWKLSSVRRSSATRDHFDIITKDGTALVAKLVKVSEAQDLALLKLDGYRTPFLKLDPSPGLSQGARVFAIGNPLGMHDAVTSGVITQITPEYLLTDAQILPGSSGGPLLLESGKVIGINVARKVAAGSSKYAAGFGKVIPVSTALREFPSVPISRGTSGFDRNPAYPEPSQWEGFGSTGLPDFGTRTNAGPGISNLDGSPNRAAVRLIIPDEDNAVDEPRGREPRSLDFPPEGTGIPPGISFPRE